MSSDLAVTLRSFFYVALFPVSNLVLRVGTIMAERFLYLPLVGFAACLAWGIARGLRPLVSRLARRGIADQLAWAALCIALCLPYVARTAARNRDWRDSIALFRATIETSPRSHFTVPLTSTQRCVSRRDVTSKLKPRPFGCLPVTQIAASADRMMKSRRPLPSTGACGRSP